MDTIMRNLIKPFIRRVGSVAAGALIAKGVDADLANQIAIGGMALITVALDLVASYKNRGPK